ncbi:gp53-like domain-containing protein [Erwinia sp. V71]|uniref:gp53-like domain-containing protein n=1 Tax=Erwinia sp. V71 TaxID=3369424 RepID=UPI003F5F64E1
MQSLMPPIDSSDSLFHNGNPLTGTKGTIVTAEWLNAVQSAIRAAQAEMLSVLAAAGIDVDPEQSSQLFTALNSLYAEQSALDNKQNKHDNLTALAGLAGAADRLPYFTGANALALATLTSVGRSIIGKATAAEVLTAIAGAPLDSPTFTGEPKAPTPAAGDNDTSIATTAFVTAAIAALSFGTASQRNVGTGTNQIPDMNSFSGYFTASASWQRLPGGLILQWGVTDAITAEALYTQALPLTFLNMCFMAQATINYSAAVSGVANHYIASISTTQIQIRSDVNGSGIAAMPSYWFAIGY